MEATRERTFPPEVTLLVAGRQNPSVHGCLSTSLADRLRKEGKMIEFNKFLNDEEETYVFSAADAVWVGYKYFYRSSGVLYLAGAMELPVIACKEGVIGWQTNKHRLGLVVDIDKPLEIVKAVLILLNNKQLARIYGHNGKKLSNQHLSTMFSNQICKIIESN